MELKELIQFAASLGVGGILAAFMFHTYHRYMAQQIEDGKEDKKMLMDVVINNTTVIAKNTSSTDNNTAVINELRREFMGRRQNRG